MVNKTILMIFIALLLVLPFASAVSTEIKIKTLPDHKVTIIIYPAESLSSLESFYVNSDGNGDAGVTHSSDNAQIDVLVKVTKDGTKVFLEKFKDYQAGKPINIKLDFTVIDGNYDPAKDEAAALAAAAAAAAEASASENVTVTETTTPPSSDVTGQVVSDDTTSKPDFKFLYYIFGILVFLVIAFFVARQFVMRGRNGTFSFKDAFASSNPFGENELKQRETPHEIKVMQDRLESAQREIRLLRNKDKVRDAEFKLKEDQKELERLKKEYGYGAA